MAVVIVQRPDPISLTGNMKELVIQSEKPVGIILTGPGGKTLEETYYPGNGNLMHIGLREVIEADLSFTLPSSDVFIQPRLSGSYKLSYNSLTGSGEIQFTAIRAGKLNLTESASSFLTGNFLTWQPNCKPVVYYSPEWLTYFAPVACYARLKAYWEDGTNTIVQAAQFSMNSCITLNMQYAVIVGKFNGKRPMYYDVWIEDTTGKRLSYVQRYIASERLGENEQWYLFENSLGGLDSLRAYGSIQDVPEYTHNLSERGNESEEYYVDVNRLHTRNTGYLTPDEARWLQDLFPARRKYMYAISGLLPIVLTESEGHTDSTELPSSYTFTYRLADTRPYLDIQRRTDLPENLKIPIPTGETFFLPPRLAEFPKPVLSPDLLIPVEEPHTEVWGATSIGAIHDAVLNDLIRDLDGLDLNPVPDGGGQNVYILKLNDLTIPSDENVFSSLRSLKEIRDANNGLLVEINDMFLRKDIDDTAFGIISFDQKIGSSVFVEGWEGKGWEIPASGAALLDSLRVRSDLYVGNKIGSPTFASGFAGWGVDVDIPTATAEMDNLFIRKTFTAYEIVYSQIYGLGGSQIISDLNKIASVEVLPDRYRCYMDDMDGLMLMNLRKGDGVRIQTRTGTTSIKYLFGRCIGVDSDYFDIAIPLLSGSGQPEAGDFAMRWGNNEDTNRQGLIYLTTADSGAPFIDVYDGITGESTEGKLKVRLGNLKDIRTQNGDQLRGYGGYFNGLYIENSTFYTENGETIDQRFVAMDGKLNSTIGGILDDMSNQSGNILVNSSFSQNTNYWTSANTVHFINVNSNYLWMDGSFYVDKEAVADIYNDGGQNRLRIRNTYILQQNALFRLPERTEVSADGYAYSFSFKYKVLRAGTLSAGFPGTDLYVEQQLSPSEGYQRLSKVAKWNEAGDFELRFTGEILIYAVSLFNDSLADAQIKLQTQIDQTNEYIKLLATKEYVDSETGAIYVHYDSQLQITAEQMSGISTKVDNISNTIDSAGWITEADGVSLFAKKEMENGSSIVNAINVGTGGIQIQANRVALSGAVSFSMLSDYSSVNSRINSAQNTANSATNSANNAWDYADSAWDKAIDAVNKATSAGTSATNAYNKALEALTEAGAIPTWAKKSSVLEAMKGESLIVGGYLNAQYITVNEIQAVKGSIAQFDIDNERLKCVVSGYSNTAKIYIGNVDSVNPNTAGARVTAIGIDAAYTVSGSIAQTAHINNMFIDNIAQSSKKTTILIKTSGGAKNTALSVYGNIAVSGDIGFMGKALNNSMPNSSTGFDHQTCQLSTDGGVYYLPTGEDIRSWFGANPNDWASYGVMTGTIDSMAYDLYVVCPYWLSKGVTIRGNPSGNEDYSSISGTPLYGDGVSRGYSYGEITLAPGRAAHFKKCARTWYLVK